MTSSITSGIISGMATNIMQEAEVDQAEKVRENRLRRMAQRQGLELHKSRVRDPRAIGYGGWFISDPSTNTIVAGGHTGNGYDLDIDAVERYLTGEES
jgi:hypothetical protein